MYSAGESKALSARGSPTGVPRSASNLTAHRLKNDPGRREMK